MRVLGTGPVITTGLHLWERDANGIELTREVDYQSLAVSGMVFTPLLGILVVQCSRVMDSLSHWCRLFFLFDLEPDHALKPARQRPGPHLQNGD